MDLNLNMNFGLFEGLFKQTKSLVVASHFLYALWG